MDIRVGDIVAYHLNGMIYKGFRVLKVGRFRVLLNQEYSDGFYSSLAEWIWKWRVIPSE